MGAGPVVRRHPQSGLARAGTCPPARPLRLPSVTGERWQGLLRMLVRELAGMPTR